MKVPWMFLGIMVASCSASGSKLGALLLTGPELHATLTTPPFDSIRSLPPGFELLDNPHLTTDETLVATIARSSSQGRLGADGIRAALYARYAAAEGELGIYGLEASSDADADQREQALREIWARNERRDLARVHRHGRVLIVAWHAGIPPACWEAANARIRERLAAP